ncbi:hypothetical protein RND71_019403 [Anisodus tanguticus]|uniref:Uncharacterized protein n=1 Tax=Anisodus tanguticus TaxID=243964 RepID=A0AAE1RZ17_9SOLA|nr:hypothetical protein RND71_019403 [Anisodus tanguticus]
MMLEIFVTKRPSLMLIGEYPFVVGYVEGEYPKLKLFLNCINEFEPTKYQAATVNCGLDALFNMADHEQSDGPSERLDEKLVPICANKPMVHEKKGNMQSFSLIDSDLEHKLQLDASNSQSKLEENKDSVIGVTIENYSIRDDFTCSFRKDSVVLDYNYDDWMLIEGKEEGQERKVANKFSLKRCCCY